MGPTPFGPTQRSHGQRHIYQYKQRKGGGNKWINDCVFHPAADRDGGTTDWLVVCPIEAEEEVNETAPNQRGFWLTKGGGHIGIRGANQRREWSGVGVCCGTGLMDVLEMQRHRRSISAGFWDSSFVFLLDTFALLRRINESVNAAEVVGCSNKPCWTC